MEASDYCIVSTTTDTKENAELITQTLLKKKLVACVHSETISSSYRWQKKIILADEIQLHLKSKTSLYDRIRNEIESLHTYDTPEIIMMPLLDANPLYLEWIEKETL